MITKHDTIIDLGTYPTTKQDIAVPKNAGTYPTTKQDIAVPKNAYVMMAPKFLKKCL